MVLLFRGTQLRIAYEGAFYHVTSRGNQREQIFWDDKVGEGDRFDKKNGRKVKCIIWV
jgi:hypothetical protein